MAHGATHCSAAGGAPGYDPCPMRELPQTIRSKLPKLFWDVDVAQLDPELHEDFMLGRLLNEGDWEVVQALRSALGDEGLAAFVRRAGRRLDRRTRRFLEVVLEIPPEPCTTTSSTQRSAPLFRP
jgi:hypothetical protein